MELTNANRIQKGFDVLLPIFIQEIRRVFESTYSEHGDAYLLATVCEQWPNDFINIQAADVLNYIDISKACAIIDKHWSDFQAATPSKIYHHKLRAYISELRETRNDLAHKTMKPISDEDTRRTLDTMIRVCDILAPNESEGIRRLLRDLLYSKNEDASQLPLKARNSKAQTKRELEAILPEGRLKAWRSVMEPNADVASDRYKNAEFAAHLGAVAKNEGAQEYVDPVDFFHRTYLTHGMSKLLIQAIRRVATGYGDPVIQLKTSFGGGKTHTMLTLLHLMRQRVQADALRGIPEILEQAGVSALPKVHVVTIVGTDLEPTKGRRPPELPGVTVNTIWGEIAAQLAIEAQKPELYQYVKESDKKGVSPGREALRNLFDACGSCMILIDEFVAYARKLYGASGLQAGTFDNLMTFVQELAEAASTSKNSLVVASIPESDIEIGQGEGGQVALKSIEKYFGRVESVWTPVEPSESFEIVRRRLFRSCDDEEAREAVCEEFSRMYYEHKTEFPAEASEVSYKNRLKSCYPIHPDVFDKLYHVWATIDSFQRTRGVLRYMAGVVHYLWDIGDQSPLIMPWAMPFCDQQVSGELIKHLGANNVWQPIISKEVDGSQSKPKAIDAEGRFGQLNAARRVTRMIMFSTAPSLRSQKVKGITKKDIHLGVCMPGEAISTYDDALEKLTEELTFLYCDTQTDAHYWFDTRPTLRKMMLDRTQQIEMDDVVQEIKNILGKCVKKSSFFNSVHTFPNIQERIADDQYLHLVILGLEQTHSGGDRQHLKATQAAEYILKHSGTQPRHYKNTMIFLAPDVDQVQNIVSCIKQKLAWISIRSDSDRNIINLGKIEINEIAKNIDKLSQSIDALIYETFAWLLVPEQEFGNHEIEWSYKDIRGQGALMDRITRKLTDDEMILTKWAPRFLNEQLKQSYWKERNDIEIKTLWQDMTKYCYMKRLANFDVLKKCIQDGIGNYFGYSSGGLNDNQKYVGLTLVTQNVEDTGFIVKLDTSQTQINEENAKQATERQPQNSDNTFHNENRQTAIGTADGTRPAVSGMEPRTPYAPPLKPPVTQVKKTSYYASKRIESSSMTRALKADFIRQVLEEIIVNLEDDVDEPVEITLDIKASNARGFSQSTLRTISENAKILGFDTSEFD